MYIGPLMHYIGIDNGVTGSIAVLRDNGSVALHTHTPVKKELNYTKNKQWITRVDSVKLQKVLQDFSGVCFCFLERPMTARFFKPVVSGMRALEATLVVLEALRIPYRYIDSREWQGALLPKGLEGPELKSAGKDIARRLFPSVEIKKGMDADALLIAEYARRKNRGKI